MNIKKGISLIVLVITIIIIIILTSAIIASVNDGEVFNNANEMKFKTDIASFKEELSNYITHSEYEYTSKGKVYDGSLLNATKDYVIYDEEVIDGKTILDIIPSLSKESYLNKLQIQNGKLQYISEYSESDGEVNRTNINSEKEENWASSIEVETIKKYDANSNIMRTELFESAVGIKPYGEFIPQKINDGIKNGTSTGFFAHTAGKLETQNLNHGVELNFKEEVTLKKINYHSYAIKVTEFTIQAYVDDEWKTVLVHTVNTTKSPHVFDLSANEVSSNKWKIYVSKVDDRSSNFYSFEVEAYI